MNNIIIPIMLILSVNSYAGEMNLSENTSIKVYDEMKEVIKNTGAAQYHTGGGRIEGKIVCEETFNGEEGDRPEGTPENNYNCIINYSDVDFTAG
jgi:hypothetical protein